MRRRRTVVFRSVTALGTAPSDEVRKTEDSLVKPPPRRDIQGLRAVAVGLVLIWHAGQSWLPGGYVGVDVFFVISGYLMTSILVREVQTSGGVALGSFYVRRMRRLFPAALTTLLAVLAGSYLVLPEARRESIGLDVVSSAFYVVNWRMADQSVDYMADNSALSPVQHYWSLAVEEQFYLIWPVLLLVCALLFRQRGAKFTAVVGIALTIIITASLAWSVHYTSTDPERAYFVTTTRLWELALGGLAVVLASLFARLPSLLATALGWLGLGMIAYSALAFDQYTAFPGSAALVPTCGALFIIAFGPGGSKFGPVAVLGLRPFTWVGDLSYSLYLWHWPMLVIVGYLFIDPQVGTLEPSVGLILALASFVPAYLSYRYVEEPFRKPVEGTSSVRSSLGSGLLASFVVGTLGMTFVLSAWPPPVNFTYRPPTASSLKADDDAEPFGAEVLGLNPAGSPVGRPVDQVPSITPAPEAAKSDTPGEGCHQNQEDAEATYCVYGDEEDPRGTMVLIGDSKAEQWTPAFATMAIEEGWQLKTYTKSACPFTDAIVVLGNGAYDSCHEWGERVKDDLLEERPDFIVTTSSSYLMWRNGAVLSSTEGRPEMIEGTQRVWRDLLDEGIGVVVLNNSPAFPFDVAECVAENRDQLSDCSYPRDEALADGTAGRTQDAAPFEGVKVVDLNDAVCPAEECAPVIGGVLVYRDTVHITATYAASVADYASAEFARLMS